ncbi:MAG: CoA transferase [Roseovarius sp.]|nr:CoA transferase [Roseovarius sp.]
MTQTPASEPVGGPLAGLRVIDLTSNVLGPVATQILGDMGAEVIKIEEPSGDYTRQVGPGRSPGMGSFFMTINRNKRSVVLDLKRPEARSALMRLVATADVFVHSMRPGAADRLGIGYAEIAAVRPDIVYGSVSGFRPGSSLENEPAFDDVIQGRSGLAALSQMRGRPPEYMPMVIADKLCGHQFAMAVALALVWRQKTGEGQHVHLSMYEAMVAFNLVEHFWGAAVDMPELGIGYPRVMSPHRRPYATQDGHICVMANTDAQWQRMFVAMDRPDLSGDPRFASARDRARHIDTLYAIVADRIQARSTAEWERRLRDADIPHGPVHDFAAVLADPYLAETGFFQRMEHPTEGPVVMTGFSSSFSKSPPAIRAPAPRMGADTAAVLAGIGLSEAEIRQLSDE